MTAPSPISADPGSTSEELDPVFLLADSDPQAMKAMNTDLISAFRAANGHLDGPFRDVPLLLLTTTGARSGRPFTTPVNYTLDRQGWVVVASKSGSVRHPDWFYNLLADPAATVEIGDQQVQVRAEQASGSQRQHLFDRHAAQLPNFAAYQRRTSRALRVFLLRTT